jgi:hypothetical protein
MVVARLQVEPQLRTGPEEARKAERIVRRDGPIPVYNLVDALGGTLMACASRY